MLHRRRRSRAGALCCRWSCPPSLMRSCTSRRRLRRPPRPTWPAPQAIAAGLTCKSSQTQRCSSVSFVVQNTHNARVHTMSVIAAVDIVCSTLASKKVFNATGCTFRPTPRCASHSSCQHISLKCQHASFLAAMSTLNPHWCLAER